MTMRRSRGFTFLEALISIVILSLVMIVALTLLVSMRSFASSSRHSPPRARRRAAPSTTCPSSWPARPT
ncbi:MAG: type II secretion system protein [Holophagales bacterium]|nr:type II secretion system protein [Holophagales bacterium]